uniref:CwfJ_C_1 domain-containing protein n=1 Tax=Syphacia muris TaxID=451379 RepID=A0A0N5AD60_9BILA
MYAVVPSEYFWNGETAKSFMRNCLVKLNVNQKERKDGEDETKATLADKHLFIAHKHLLIPALWKDRNTGYYHVCCSS